MRLAAVLLLVGDRDRPLHDRLPAHPNAGRSTLQAPGSTDPVWSPHSAQAIQICFIEDLRPRSIDRHRLQARDAFLAANNSSSGARDSLAMYSARLVALDKVFDATESALQAAPHDPVINQYYLATMGARTATRQMVARPVALRGF